MRSPESLVLPVDEDITLRYWRHGDEEDLVQHANNYKIWLNLSDIFPHPYTMNNAKEWIDIAADRKRWQPTVDPTSKTVDETDEAFAARKEASKIPTDFAICHRDKAIGSVSLMWAIQTYPRSAEIGYWLGEEYWGKGIMTKAATTLLQWGFDTFPWLVRIGGNAYSWNKGSMNILKKLGMQPEGVHKLKGFKNGKYGDLHHFAKIREGFTPEMRE